MKEYSILIVDDEKVDRYLLKRTLAKANVQGDVLEASDGKEALEFLEDYEGKKQELGPKFPPVVIFLDINMPLLNGFDFLERFNKLRNSHDEYVSCVIMMFSSSENPADRERAFSYEFVRDFIMKGDISPDEISDKVNKIIEQS